MIEGSDLKINKVQKDYNNYRHRFDEILPFVTATVVIYVLVALLSGAINISPLVTQIIFLLAVASEIVALFYMFMTWRLDKKIKEFNENIQQENKDFLESL